MSSLDRRRQPRAARCGTCKGGGLTPSCGGICPGSRHVCRANTCPACGGSGYQS